MINNLIHIDNINILLMYKIIYHNKIKELETDNKELRWLLKLKDQNITLLKENNQELKYQVELQQQDISILKHQNEYLTKDIEEILNIVNKYILFD